MSHNISSSSTSAIYTQQANEKRKKDEEKQSEMIAALITILQDVVNTVATSESGSPDIGTKKLENDSQKLSDIINNKEDTSKSSCCLATTSSSSVSSTGSSTSNTSSITSSYPSSDEIADALAAMATMISDLEAEMQMSSNEQYKMACEIMIAQMTVAMNVLYDYENTINYVDTEWAKYNQYISDHMSQYTDWMNHKRTEMVCVETNGHDQWVKKSYPDPEIDKVENDIEQYCKNEFGIDIYLDPNCTDLNAIIQSANDQVYSYLTSLMDVAESNVETAFLYSTNPMLQQLGKMIFNDAAINDDAIKALEAILNETLNTLTVLTDTSTTNYNEGPSNGMIIQILSIMTSTISNLEAMISKFEAKQSEDNTDISKKYGDAAKISLQKAVDQLNYITKLIHEMEKDQKMNEIMGYVTAGLMIAVGAATGNLELVIIASGMLALEETGAMDQLKEALTDAYTGCLVKSGVSEEQARKDAKILADVTVVLIVAVACCGVGMLVSGFESALAESASEGEATAAGAAAKNASSSALKEAISNMTQNISEMVMSSIRSAWEVVSSSSFTLSSDLLLSALRSSTEMMMSALSSAAEVASAGLKSAYEMIPELTSSTKQLALMMALQEVASTQITTDITVASLSAYTNLSDEEIQKRAMIAETVVDVAAMLGTIAISCSSSSSTAQTRRFVPELIKNNLNTIFLLSAGISFGASMVETGANIDRSILLKKQADSEKVLGESQADLTFFLGLQEMSNTNMQENMQEYQQTLNTRQKIDSNMLQNMLSFQAEYTKVLNQSA